MIENGFYIIKDSFFKDFPDPYLKSNKGEHRPHYYAFQDKRTGLFWMIPMSSQLNKYRALIKRQEERGKRCKALHICRLDNGRESVFLIQDMFPVSESYIQRAYTIGANHLCLTKDAQVRVVRSKAEGVLAMLRRGVRFTPTQPDVLAIEKHLLRK